MDLLAELLPGDSPPAAPAPARPTRSRRIERMMLDRNVRNKSKKQGHTEKNIWMKIKQDLEKKFGGEKIKVEAESNRGAVSVIMKKIKEEIGEEPGEHAPAPAHVNPYVVVPPRFPMKKQEVHQPHVVPPRPMPPASACPQAKLAKPEISYVVPPIWVPEKIHIPHLGCPGPVPSDPEPESIAEISHNFKKKLQSKLAKLEKKLDSKLDPPSKRLLKRGVSKNRSDGQSQRSKALRL